MLIAVWSDVQHSIIDTALDQWRKHLPPLPGHVSVQMVDIWNIFCEQTLANNYHFHVFLVQVASAHGVRFLLC